MKSQETRTRGSREVARSILGVAVNEGGGSCSIRVSADLSVCVVRPGKTLVRRQLS